MENKFLIKISGVIMILNMIVTLLGVIFKQREIEIDEIKIIQYIVIYFILASIVTGLSFFIGNEKYNNKYNFTLLLLIYLLLGGTTYFNISIIYIYEDINLMLFFKYFNIVCFSLSALFALFYGVSNLDNLTFEIKNLKTRLNKLED